MENSDIVSKLSFDIKQIDNTIDILQYILNGNILSPNGEKSIESNIKSLWVVQHDLQQLRINFERKQKNESPFTLEQK